MSRFLICTACHTEIEVFEAALGADSDAEHEYLDPRTYVGGVCGCLQPLPVVEEDEVPTKGMEALGRARTARERATNREGAV